MPAAAELPEAALVADHLGQAHDSFGKKNFKWAGTDGGITAIPGDGLA
jgi:hypothetical protein